MFPPSGHGHAYGPEQSETDPSPERGSRLSALGLNPPELQPGENERPQGAEPLPVAGANRLACP